MSPTKLRRASGLVGRYSAKSTAAGLDLGLYAAGNLALNVLLARAVGADDYGRFTTVFVTYLFLATVHESVFTEPMLVFGAKEPIERRGGYLRALLRGHFAVMVPLAGSIAVAMLLLMHAGPLRSIALTAALCTPVLTAAQMMSRAAYLGDRAWLPAYSSGAYLAAVLVGATTLDALDRLTPSTALVAMAVAGIIEALPVLSALGLWHRSLAQPPVARRHWSYSRWSAAASAVRWVPANVPILAVSAWVGFAAASQVRAAALFTTPALLGISALSLLALPSFARDTSLARVRRRARLLAVGLSTSGLLLVVLAGLVGPQVVSAVLGSEFEPSRTLIMLMAAMPSVTCVTAIYGAVLRSLERPAAIFRAGVVSLVCTVAIGLPLIAWFGASGAAGALLASNVGMATAIARAARRALVDGSEQDPSPG